MSDKKDMLYNPKAFVCMESENFKEYFEEYSKLVNENMKMNPSLLPDDLKRDLLFNKLGVSLNESEKEDLENVCDPQNLTFDEEIKIAPTSSFYQPTSLNITIPPCADHLKVIQTKKKWSNKFGKVFPYPNQTLDRTDPLDQNLTPYSDTVFIVKDYHPFKRTKKDRVKCNFEIAILSTQTLADLRDKISCPNDLGYSEELESPAETLSTGVKENYPSAFMFIENCFYNDMRNENAIDYSEPIREWGEWKKMIKWTTGLMENTKIGDLKVRLGYPYVYQHQGDCEHIIIFADVRLLRERDSLNIKEYPYFQYESRSVCCVCFMCGHAASKYVVMDSDRMPNKLTYMCGECLVSYNYIDGEKVGDFKLYPYFDRSSS